MAVSLVVVQKFRKMSNVDNETNEKEVTSEEVGKVEVGVEGKTSENPLPPAPEKEVATKDERKTKKDNDVISPPSSASDFEVVDSGSSSSDDAEKEHASKGEKRTRSGDVEDRDELMEAVKTTAKKTRSAPPRKRGRPEKKGKPEQEPKSKRQVPQRKAAKTGNDAKDVQRFTAEFVEAMEAATDAFQKVVQAKSK